MVAAASLSQGETTHFFRFKKSPYFIFTVYCNTKGVVMQRKTVIFMGFETSLQSPVASRQMNGYQLENSKSIAKSDYELRIKHYEFKMVVGCPVPSLLRISTAS